MKTQCPPAYDSNPTTKCRVQIPFGAVFFIIIFFDSNNNSCARCILETFAPFCPFAPRRAAIWAARDQDMALVSLAHVLTGITDMLLGRQLLMTANESSPRTLLAPNQMKSFALYGAHALYLLWTRRPPVLFDLGFSTLANCLC